MTYTSTPRKRSCRTGGEVDFSRHSKMEGSPPVGTRGQKCHRTSTKNHFRTLGALGQTPGGHRHAAVLQTCAASDRELPTREGTAHSAAERSPWAPRDGTRGPHSSREGGFLGSQLIPLLLSLETGAELLSRWWTGSQGSPCGRRRLQRPVR